MMLPREIRTSENVSILDAGRALVVATAPIGCPECHVARAFFVIHTSRGETSYTCILCERDAPHGN